MTIDVDPVALRSAMEFASRHPVRAQHYADMERTEGWRYAAEAAAHFCHCEALKLRPWEEPPSVADEQNPRDRDRRRTAFLRACWPLVSADLTQSADRAVEMLMCLLTRFVAIAVPCFVRYVDFVKK